MYKLFDIAGYSKSDVDQKFSGMINALSYGAPPHGGIAPGIDRIVMLLADEKGSDEQNQLLKIVKDITSKGFVRNNYKKNLVDLSDVKISLKGKK